MHAHTISKWKDCPSGSPFFIPSFIPICICSSFHLFHPACIYPSIYRSIPFRLLLPFFKVRNPQPLEKCYQKGKYEIGNIFSSLEGGRSGAFVQMEPWLEKARAATVGKVLPKGIKKKKVTLSSRLRLQGAGRRKGDKEHDRSCRTNFRFKPMQHMIL